MTCQPRIGAARDTCSMDLGISGRVALVGGATQGIGRAVAETLVAEGARVVVTARDEGRTANVAVEIGAEAGFGWDTGETDAAADVVDRVEKRVGPVDILVTNTGGPPSGPDPLAFTDAQWEEAHRHLVLAPLALLRRVLPGMRERGWGRVIAISSSAARLGLSGQAAYAASKAGLHGLIRTLAIESRAHGITANCVLPGMVATPTVLGMPEPVLKRVLTGMPMGRMATSEEVAALVAFLAGEEAGYITAQEISIDGGLGLNPVSLGSGR